MYNGEIFHVNLSNLNQELHFFDINLLSKFDLSSNDGQQLF